MSHQSREDIGGEWRKSPNGAYAFLVRESDRTKAGPWTIEHLVDTEREHLLRLAISDYKSARARWINEKLLYVEVWWGRILGTYLILDVESEEFIAREMIHDGSIAFEQWQMAKEAGVSSRRMSSSEK